MVNVNGNIAEFTFFRPNAQKVSLCGEFNNWRNDQIVMTRNEKGVWSVKLRLGPGNFRFRYCADGEWFADYAACGIVPGRFGLDSVVSVSAQPIVIPQPAAETDQAEEIVAA